MDGLVGRPIAFKIPHVDWVENERHIVVTAYSDCAKVSRIVKE